MIRVTVPAKRMALSAPSSKYQLTTADISINPPLNRSRIPMSCRMILKLNFFI
jgi:hypothetical protein